MMDGGGEKLLAAGLALSQSRGQILAAHENSPIRERGIPASCLDRRRDVLGADIAFGKSFLIQLGHRRRSSHRRALVTGMFP